MASEFKMNLDAIPINANLSTDAEALNFSLCKLNIAYLDTSTADLPNSNRDMGTSYHI